MHLQDIYIYPVKSLGGIRLDESYSEPRGLQYDRRWMLADKQGTFLTQRTLPQMALLKVDVTASGLSVHHTQDPENRILIPFEPKTNTMLPVKIWQDVVTGQLADPDASRWFSDHLNYDCDLIYMPASTRRTVDPEYAVNNDPVSFADGMPYLLISQASLDDLNSRLTDPVGMSRFRPNLVIAGCEPFEEDTWDEIAIGETVFKIVKPCARCIVTTVDQDTGIQGKEPLKTLSGYRKFGNKVLFGQNMVLVRGTKITAGCEMTIHTCR
ncbi:MAG: MOSC domain-containing protein [Cyclonatronaceae bacterium]